MTHVNFIFYIYNMKFCVAYNSGIKDIKLVTCHPFHCSYSSMFKSVSVEYYEKNSVGGIQTVPTVLGACRT
jgi:hypothetical protein